MHTAIKLDINLIKIAKFYSRMQNRSMPKQIEYWAKIGRIIEQNPDLNYNAIRGILLGLEDFKIGNVKEFHIDSSI